MAVPRQQDDPARTLRFSVFEADLKAGELTKRGARVRLPDKPFQVLTALLLRPGEVVTRQELQTRLWSEETFVDFDNNLNAAVRKLREALGDSADSPRFVETLPKRGYRFIAPVEDVSDATQPPAAVAAVARRRMRPVALVVALVLPAVAVVIATSVLRRPDGTGTPPPAENRLMLAVMPFADLDNRPDRQFFGDGLTEEMITQLGRLQPERLGVIARMSSMQYRGTQKPLDVIGSELGVDYILEGSVRSFGERVRITAQLIHVSDQTHLWAESYDAELGDLLQVQDDVALRVAQALALELLPDQPLAQARAGTRVTAAYEAYLRGRYEWNTFSGDRYPHAIEQFKRAIELDPSYAAAWAGLADTYNLQSFTANVRPREAYPLARDAALEALKHDSNSAMAHNSLAFVLLYHDYDLRAADLEFRRAIELAPNYAMAYHWWAGALAALERHDDAIEAIRHAVELDPVELSVLSDMGWYYLFADRWDEGVAECRRILEMQDYGWARSCIFEGLIGAGRLDDALQLTPYSDPAVAAGFEGQDAESVLRTLREQALQDRLGNELLRERYPLEIALAYAALGDGDGAFEWLERAYELRDPWLVFLRVDPRFDRISGDPRFDGLARRVGLPS